MSGTLHLVGVGPGDPELLTLKAVRILGTVPVVAYPAAGDNASMALSIAGGYLHPEAQHIAIAIPMTAEREPARTAYDEGAGAILNHLHACRDVAWLCEGDPLFYGSAMYLMGRVAAHAPVIVVPGVTSITAAAAAIRRPLAARNEVLKVLPATLPDAALRLELQTAEAVAIIKVGRHFDRVRSLLDDTGHAPGAVVVEHATSERQRVTRLAEFAHDERPYFSTILCYRGQEDWGPA